MKRDLKALQRRRLRAARLLAQGVPQAEVARRVGVSRQSVSAWAKKLDAAGTKALKASPLGRPGSFDAAQRRELTHLLKRGALAAGFPTELWTLPRVGALIKDRFGHQYSEVHVWRLLRELGFSCQRPSGRAIQRNEPAIREWKQQQWPALKKNAKKRGQTIVFVDESGLSERPTRVRTWAPRGQTPVLQYSFSWKQLSAIAGVTFWQFYFRLFPGSIKGPQIVEFLAALNRQIRGPLLIIWDGLKAPKSKVVREYIEREDVDIQLAFLPAYAPELNPVEYLWGYLKTHEIGNLCAHTLTQVSDFARRRLRSMQRRPALVTAFWKQAELPV